MPRLIDPGSGEALTLDALVAALDASDFDVRDEDSFASAGPLLARLGRNPDFLADMVLSELKARCHQQSAINSYGPQVFLLRPNNGRYVLRANFWPARDDPAVRASGTAPFFYDVPHDHNFPFLTYGYLGPGYWSDYYEYDAAAIDSVPGEVAGLRFVERARLAPGSLMLYRQGVDVHAQLPPDSFSVSLNILGYDLAQPWRDQRRFDVAAGTVVNGLTTAASEALVALAVEFGGGNGVDLAQDFAAAHPCPRMRFTALTALAGQVTAPDDRSAVYECGLRDASGYVARRAARELKQIQAALTP